jgi:hypothetical protein
MTLKSLFLRPHDGSDCGGGFCRHDPACTSNCAGHPRNVGVEAALPASFIADPPKKAREPIEWQSVFVWGAVTLCITAVAALSLYRP